jgi:hypothetical protein
MVAVKEKKEAKEKQFTESQLHDAVQLAVDAQLSGIREELNEARSLAREGASFAKLQMGQQSSKTKFRKLGWQPEPVYIDGQKVKVIDPDKPTLASRDATIFDWPMWADSASEWKYRVQLGAYVDESGRNKPGEKDKCLERHLQLL